MDGGEIWIITPPYRHIRVRSWAVDDTGDEPKLVYVYSHGETPDEPTKLWLDVSWDGGGMSCIRNDHNVTWLDGVRGTGEEGQRVERGG